MSGWTVGLILGVVVVLVAAAIVIAIVRLAARIAAPIGLDLGGTSSEETAVSIMAELIAVRNGRDGGRLSASRGRIHEVGT